LGKFDIVIFTQASKLYAFKVCMKLRSYFDKILKDYPTVFSYEKIIAYEDFVERDGYKTL